MAPKKAILAYGQTKGALEKIFFRPGGAGQRRREKSV
jgi:hypothetical protein